MNHKGRIASIASISISILLNCWAEPSIAARFLPLDDLPGGASESAATSISANSGVVVGRVATNPSPLIDGLLRTVRWRIPNYEGESLGESPPVATSFFIFDISGHGEVIVGGTNLQDYTLPTDQRSQPFRWTEASGFESLPLVIPFVGGNASAVSNDGKTIVGVGLSGLESIALRWTPAGQVQVLGTLPTQLQHTRESYATDVSADGSIVVGASSKDDVREAFRWSESTGLIGLGDLPGGAYYSEANGISADGATIVGGSASLLSPNGAEAFRWNAHTGMMGLGLLDVADTSSYAHFSSADGRLIFGISVGQYNINNPSGFIRSFVWSETAGMRSFRNVLEQDFFLDSDLAGWSNLIASDISEDSLTIVGSGINPDGKRQAWLVQLDNPIGVPEPSTLVLALALISGGYWLAKR